jgi:site-specific DNA-methyltransferase (cytosine-N4-specific)
MSTAVSSKLDSVGWDFKDAPTRNGSHSIHPYPAKFIPLIPKNLIELFYPGDGSKILDPFCGSGTTLVESMNMGIDSVGIDLHPLAALIAKVKTTPISADLLAIGKQVSISAQKKVSEQAVSIPEIPNVDHWFQKHIQIALAVLISEINSIEDSDISNALKVAFSSIVVRVSNQDSDTRYAAIEKNVTQVDVWNHFERAAKSVGLVVSGIGEELFSNRPQIKIITKDLMQVEPDEVGKGIGLVITSPPYPNAYEYWLYHKYRMYWLGMDPIAVREKEIGARPHYFKKNHQTEEDFERQMERCFWLLSKVMIPNCYACFVVGRSIIHGRHIDNEALLERAARLHGFRKVGSVARKIARNRKSFNLSHGKINEEGIMIFLLEDK